MGTNTMATPPSQQPVAGAYYLAQRQLQLMKKIGDEGSLQVYEASCLQIPNIKGQEDLLFGGNTTMRRAAQEAARGGGGCGGGGGGTSTVISVQDNSGEGQSSTA